jgi:hypothetical protein
MLLKNPNLHLIEEHDALKAQKQAAKLATEILKSEETVLDPFDSVAEIGKGNSSGNGDANQKRELQSGNMRKKMEGENEDDQDSSSEDEDENDIKFLRQEANRKKWTFQERKQVKTSSLLSVKEAFAFQLGN